jgi:hypothetical protein
MTSNLRSGGRGRQGVDDTYVSHANTASETKTKEIYATFMKQLVEQREQEKKQNKKMREM